MQLTERTGGHFLQQLFEVTSSARTIDTTLFDGLIHDALLEFTPCLNQNQPPLPQLDHILGYTLLHHVQDAIIHNLCQNCRMAT